MNECCVSCKHCKYYDDGRVYPFKCMNGSQPSFTALKAINFKCALYKSGVNR